MRDKPYPGSRYTVINPMVSMICHQRLPNLACACLALVFLAGVSCQENEIPDLVAHYSFDGSAADTNGLNKDLQVHGAKPAPDRFGKVNRAYGFDGTSAYMMAEIDGMPDLTSPHSVIWWYQVSAVPVFKDSLDAGNMIVLADTTKNIGVQFGFRAAGYETMGFDVWYWGGTTVLESAHPANNKWHHCAYTYDGERHLFFVDGVQVAEASVKPQSGIPSLLMLGNYPGGDQFFSGVLDELRIYNRTLLPSEITAIYSKEKAL